MPPRSYKIKIKETEQLKKNQRSSVNIKYKSFLNSQCNYCQICRKLFKKTNLKCGNHSTEHLLTDNKLEIVIAMSRKKIRREQQRDE